MVEIPAVLGESKLSNKFRDTAPLLEGYKAVYADERGFHEIIDVRLYGSNCVKCIIWVRDEKGNRHGWGIGRAGGYGYDKMASAVSSAFRDLGVKMSEDVNCYCGACSEEKTIKAVAEAMGYADVHVVHFHR